MPVRLTVKLQPDPSVAALGKVITTLPPIAVSSTVRMLSVLNTVYDVTPTAVTAPVAFA